jgi:hypothetical protein
MSVTPSQRSGSFRATPNNTRQPRLVCSSPGGASWVILSGDRLRATIRDSVRGEVVCQRPPVILRLRCSTPAVP